MSDDARDSFEALEAASFLPKRFVSITTRSGRRFRFDMTEYRVFPGTARVCFDYPCRREADELAAPGALREFTHPVGLHPRLFEELSVDRELADRLVLCLTQPGIPV